MQVNVLIQFHEEIQIFAVALHKLQKTTQNQTKINDDEKIKLIAEIQKQMRSVICELETVVNSTCKNIVLKRIPPSYLDSPQFSSNWSSNTDLTQMCTQDRSILTAYDSFINGLTRVFRRIKKKVLGKHNNKNKKQAATQNTDKQKPKTKRKQNDKRKVNQQNKQNKNKQKTDLKNRNTKTQMKRRQYRKNTTRKPKITSV